MDKEVEGTQAFNSILYTHFLYNDQNNKSKTNYLYVHCTYYTILQIVQNNVFYSICEHTCHVNVELILVTDW